MTSLGSRSGRLLAVILSGVVLIATVVCRRAATVARRDASTGDELQGRSILIVRVPDRRAGRAAVETLFSAYANAHGPQRITACLVGRRDHLHRCVRELEVCWRHRTGGHFQHARHMRLVPLSRRRAHVAHAHERALRDLSRRSLGRYAYVYLAEPSVLLARAWDVRGERLMRRGPRTRVYTYDPLSHSRTPTAARCVGFHPTTGMPRFDAVGRDPRADAIDRVASTPCASTRFLFGHVQQWQAHLGVHADATDLDERDYAFVQTLRFYLSGADLVAPPESLTRPSSFRGPSTAPRHAPRRASSDECARAVGMGCMRQLRELFRAARVCRGRSIRSYCRATGIDVARGDVSRDARKGARQLTAVPYERVAR